VRCFRWLFCAEADLLTTDSSFATLPQLATTCGNLEIIRLCPNSNLYFSATAHPAARNHQFNFAEWLVAFDSLVLEGLFWRLLLPYCCLPDNVRNVVRLMTAGVDPKGADRNQSTSLRVAVRRDNLATLTCLLSQAGLYQNPRCPSGLTPLSGAAKRRDGACAGCARGANRRHLGRRTDTICDNYTALAGDRELL
jgi:hypothetical protein